jgi:hypothetical protein
VLTKAALGAVALSGMALIGILSERYELEQRPDDQWRLVQKLSPNLLARANAAPLPNAPARSARRAQPPPPSSAPADAHPKEPAPQQKIF